MSQKLTITNYPSRNVVETTELFAAAVSTDTNLTVVSNQNFGIDSHVVIGRLGSESSEKIIIISVTGSTIISVDSGIQKDHAKFTPVTRLFGDQISIYRAANVDGSTPADGSFALLQQVDIDFDQSSTEYTDPAGSSDYWYKAVFYDSITATESALADSVAVRGGGYGNYASLESIRKEAGLQGNTYITDDLIDEKRQAAQALINSTLAGRYVVPFSAPINPLIAEITRVLAAGYVLTKEYGNTASSTYKEGKDKIDSVTNDGKTGTLDRLDAGSLSLLGETGVSTAATGGGNTAGWPNSSTATADASVGGAPRMIRMSDRY